MIETLDPALEPTVVSCGASGREFQALDRLAQRAINAAQLGKLVNAFEVSRRILSARELREPVDAIYGHGSRKCVLHVLPVFGPQRQVHGVQFWLGSIAVDPPEPRRAAGVVWDLPAKLVRLTIDPYRMAGLPDTEFVPELPLAMFWQGASRFDQHEAVFDLLYHPHEHGKLRTTATVQHSSGRDMLWQATIRSRYDSDTIGAWGLIEDLTSQDTRPPHATLGQQALREHLRFAGLYLGVLHIPDGSIVQWLSDPPPWIDCTCAPERLLPAEDHARLTAAVAPDEGVVRMLNREGGYTPTKIVLSPCLGRRTTQLAIGRFLRADRAHASKVPPETDVGTSPPAVGDRGPKNSQAGDARTADVGSMPSGGPSHDHLYTLVELPRILRISRTTVFELLASGALASVRIGSRRFVTSSQIDDYLASLKQG